MLTTVSLSMIIIIGLKLVSCQNRGLELLSIKEDEDPLITAKCVLQLSSKYFVEKKALSGSIVIVNINSIKSKTQKILLETIHSGIKYSVMVKDSYYHHKNASHFPEKAKNYMMILEEKEELIRNIEQLNKLPTWNPHAKAIIFIEHDPKRNELLSLTKDIINSLRSHKLLKTIVLISFPDSKEVVAYTWRPYDKNNCGGPCESVYILDICKKNVIKQKHKEDEMFPANMNFCPLNIYTVISEPYVMPPVGKIIDGVYNDHYDFRLGIEINIMKIISNITNMNLIIRMSNISEDWGSIEVGGMATGLYEKLRMDEVDIIIGNMNVDKVIRKWFDPSSSYMQDEITWCVPKADKALTWTNLLTIFKISTWIVTLSALLLIGLMLHMFAIKENANISKWPTKSILMTFGMILGWGAMFNPKKSSFRLLLFSWLLFSININTSYQSFLRSFLIHPKYEKQIETEYDIARAKLDVGGKQSLKNYFVNGGAVAQYMYDNFEECNSFRECIKKVGFDRNFAIAASRRQAIYQEQHLGKGGSLIYCFQEGNIIYKYGVVILSRKWFPMLNRFNGIIRSVSENGLIWKWNNEVFLHRATVTDTNDMVPLGMGHMLGAFLFLFMGYCTCFTIFILEIVTFRIKNVSFRRKLKILLGKNKRISFNAKIRQ